MKSLFCSILLSFLAVSITLVAQTHDERIATLLGTEDYFELNREYTLFKDSIDPTLCDFTQAMLHHVQNKPEETCKSIAHLINTHQERMDINNVLNMLSLWGVNLMKQGKYSTAANLLNSMVSNKHIQGIADPYILEKLSEINGRAQVLKNSPPIELSRTNEDCTLPIVMDKNNLMTIEVEINGNKTPFILDTGADLPAFISVDFARKHGVRILGDSIVTDGIVGRDYTQIGLIDSIKVGNIVYRNVWTLINSQPDIVHKDSLVARIDAVLGRYFIDDVGEVQIYPKEQKLVFPSKLTPAPSAASNMLLFNRQPFVELQSEGTPMTFHFDTGGGIMLNVNYFKKHQKEIEAVSRGDSISLGGFAGIKRVLTHKLPQLPLNVGGVECTLTNVRVLANDIRTDSDGEGMLGMEFVNMFDKVILNFRDMFLKVE